MRFVIAAGTTLTANIDGISGIGTNRDLIAHVPGGDVEIVEYGRIVRTPIVPIDPDLGPTPAVVTRAVCNLVDCETTIVDAGMMKPTGAPVVDAEVSMGEDIRNRNPVPSADDAFEFGKEFGRSLSEEVLYVGESIPGGTTTALGVLTALGVDATVSSSLPENPLNLKQEVVEEGLEASGLSPGDAAGNPILAVQSVGDPVLATIAGIVIGATEADIPVVLAGGTQMVAAAALVRHADVWDPLTIATTNHIADDESANIEAAAADLEVDLRVTSPTFPEHDHFVLEQLEEGAPKEGVGMGGALHLAEQNGVELADVADEVLGIHREILDQHPEFTYNF